MERRADAAYLMQGLPRVKAKPASWRAPLDSPFSIEPRQKKMTSCTEAPRKIEHEKPRYGYRRLVILLRRASHPDFRGADSKTGT